MTDEEKLRHYLKKATGELRRATRRLHEVELKDTEPIAIVGMSCRFPPDVRSAAGLWQFVLAGGDGISPFPADRGWGTVSLAGSDDEMAPGTAACQGGFVAGADQFDAEFFGISPQEALAMDPQQRLLLETAWDAVEHAGIDPASLRGTPAGVYAGVSYCNYAGRLAAKLPAAVEDHLLTGGAASTTSGRVSYVLGLRGPAISIDTACSSSLVAIHLAIQGLRRGDCHLALAGGASIMATPDVIIEFSRRGALASDGRCKPFAAAADGMGFGEGAGLLVLERLSTALRDGHPVLALIRGSAVNQDGATNGMTSPSRAAQEAVMRQALADARLTADQVDVVEGHGTGTPLGDSVEAEAVIAAYGEARQPGHPLRLGSVKSNIGHTQAASGVAGVITMVMSIRAGAHARTLHADRPSAYVDWAAGNVALAAGPAPWPANGHPRRAGVSSFGISGTNAHLILEEPPAAEPGDCAPSPGADGAPVPWVLSAKTGQSLRVMAAQLSDFIAAHPGTAPAGVGISLARTRTGFRHRAVTVGATLSEHLAALAALARGERAPGLVTGEATATAKTAELSAGRRPRAGDASQELARLAEAYVGGAAVSWEAAFTGTGTGPVRLPGYPFQRERYWLDAPVPADRAMIAVAGEPAHPLLGAAIDLADSADQWFTRTLTPREPWYTAQYRLCGAHALPPAAIAEWALAASRHAGRESGGAPTIENLAFGDPVTFPGRLPLAIEAAAEASGAVRKVRGFSRNPGDADSRWTRRFTALASGDSPPDPGPVDLGQLRSRMTERDPGALFARLGERGIDYGPAFRHITGSWQSVDEALVLIDAGAAAADGDLYGLHPVVLETCFLSAMPLACDAGLWLPSGLARLTHYRELPRRLWCHARRALGNAAQGGPLHLELLSDSGEPLVVITGLTYDAADPAALAPPAATLAETETARSWDADELSRLALEQPETARQALMDILLGRVTDLVESPPADRESLRTRFGSARLGELGLDSLRVMRLREEFRAQLRVDVPPQRLLGDATVADIADLVCRFLAARNLVMTADEPGTAGQPEELIL